MIIRYKVIYQLKYLENKYILKVSRQYFKNKYLMNIKLVVKYYSLKKYRCI